MYPVEPETERLVLRELTPRLAERLWPLVRAEHSIFGSPDMAETEHELRAWLARREHDAQEDDRRQYRWLLERKDTGEIIGSTRCHIEDPLERRGSIGYAILTPHRRQGFAIEAAACSVAFGFEQLGLDRIASAIEPHNEASMRLIAKLGFTRGRFVQQAIRERDGVRLDAYLWVLDAEEWRARAVACPPMETPTIVPFGGLRQTPGRIHPIIEYLLDLVGEPRAKVAIIPTATGDSTQTLVGMYQRFPADRTERSHLALFNRTVKDIQSYLLEQDIILVGGGNTANMLAVWRVHGVDVALRAAWEAGVVLTGGSAGSLCWFEGGTTDSFDLFNLEPLHDGLGFLPGSHCPHYDGEEQRRPLYHRLVGEGFPAGYAIDEDAAIRFDGTERVEVVSGRPGATAYRVERVGADVIETPLEARLLG